MKVERKEHPLYKEFSGDPLRSPAGRWQYLYSSPQGKVSLIKLVGTTSGVEVWEIYCLEGGLFEGTIRFGNKEEAVKKIKELLEGR